jgi:hypothetical protein
MVKTNSQFAMLFLATVVAMAAPVVAALAQDDDPPQPNQAAVDAARELLDLEVALKRIDKREGDNKQRDRFESTLKSRIDKVHRRYPLSKAQTKKLLLAGRADIRRYFATVEELETKLALARVDRVEELKLLNEITTNIHRPGQDIFDERSLFSKILASTLTREQAARHQVLEREIAVEHHRATIDWVLGTWDQTLGLTAGQHERLRVLFSNETRPPRKFGPDDYFGVLCQVSRISEVKLKSILSASQWAALRPEFGQAKQMEPTLTQSGYVPENDVAAAPSHPDVTPETKAGKERG